ncbi:MAG: recombinase RecA [Halobacteria archaeon]|nr:recombinase RecA [Halobacteria archaeon]
MTYKFGISHLDDALGELEGGTNVLVSGPSMSGKDKFAYSVISEGIRQDNGIIFVSTKDSGPEILDYYRDNVDGFDPERFGIVDCVSASQGMSDVEETDNMKLVSSPDDMTGIGVKVSQLLEDYWKEKEITENRIYLNSVSTLLMYSNLQTVFRFLHVFTGRVKSVEGFGLFEIDSEMHDQQTYSTLKQLFDGIVEVRQEDKGPELRARGITSNPTDWMSLEVTDTKA